MVALGSILTGAALAVDGRLKAIGERQEASCQEQRARDAASFLLEDMVGIFDIDYRGNHAMSIGQLLEAAAERAQVRFAGDPELLAQLMSQIARSYLKMGRVADGDGAMGLALEAAVLAHGDPSPEVFELRLALFDLRYGNGRLVSKELFDALAQNAQDLFPKGSPAHLRVRQRRQMRIGELEDVVAEYERRSDVDIKDHLIALERLATRYMFSGDEDRRLLVLRQLLGMQETLHGKTHSAAVVARCGRHREPEPELRRALALQRQHWSAEHPMIHAAELALGQAQEALELAESVLGPVPGILGDFLAAEILRARSLARLGRSSEACERLRRARSGPSPVVPRATLGPDLGFVRLNQSRAAKPHVDGGRPQHFGYHGAPRRFSGDVFLPRISL